MQGATAQHLGREAAEEHSGRTRRAGVFELTAFIDNRAGACVDCRVVCAV